jgi:crotonobetainyl-CoA:carnitine CoA-transferase CaiB-like acyl-CoA transferase
VACGPVNDLAQAFALADRLGLAPRAVIADGTDSPMDLVANPISLSGTPPRYDRRPPRLGEHTGEIADWLDS